MMDDGLWIMDYGLWMRMNLRFFTNDTLSPIPEKSKILPCRKAIAIPLCSHTLSGFALS